MTRAEETPDIACSLPPKEMSERADELRAIAARALSARSRDPGCVRLEFRRSTSVEAAIGDLVRRERECCPFLELEIHRSGEVLALEIAAPAEAQPMLDAIYEQSAPEAQLPRRVAP